MKKTYNNLLQYGQKALTLLVDKVPLRTYLYIFVFVVVGMAFSYRMLTPYGHGVGENSVPLSNMTIMQGLYFSIVTISSLGYGDMHPMGFSKAIACSEVLFGLALMGIIIAKVTSRRLSYHVQRLFSSDAQKRLEDFAARSKSTNRRLEDAMQLLGNVYQEIPGKKDSDVNDVGEAIKSLNEALIASRSIVCDTNDYIAYEIEQGDYFSVVPRDEILRLGDCADEAINRIGQLIISLSPKARSEALDADNRKLIAEIVDVQQKICGMVKAHSKDADIKVLFERVKKTCSAVPESYFIVPEPTEEMGQPDQVAEVADDPDGFF